MDISESHALLVARAEPEQWRRIAARAASYVSRHGGAKTMRDGHLVLLLASETPGGTARDVARELGQALGEPITVGATSVSLTPDTARRAYRRALQALDTLASLGQWGSGATIEELGFVGMLLGETRDVAGFVEQTVGPVLEYDRDRSAELELTLEAYFAAGGSPTYAAEKLQVHPNTVSRRLERVSQLLGPDWQEPAHALEIQLALRLRRVRDSLDGTDG
jgi:DNA-binding PucR family transcriptional regulator